MSGSLLFVAILGIAMVIASKVRVAADHERFAVFILGQFVCLKGPGLLIKWSGRAVKWVRVGLGERGELVSNDKLKLIDTFVPARVNGAIALGAEYLITGFGESEVLVSRTETSSESAAGPN